MANSINIKKLLTQDPENFNGPNKMNSDICQKIIDQMTKDERKQMQIYINKRIKDEHLKGNSQFFAIRAYLYNNFVKPIKDEETEMISTFGFSKKSVSKGSSLLNYLNSL